MRNFDMIRFDRMINLNYSNFVRHPAGEEEWAEETRQLAPEVLLRQRTELTISKRSDRIMKKILAMAAAAALAAGASVYAANPFSDVSTSDWAYQAVADLSGQGVVEGYPDGTFKGEKNITRYEMAQIVARLMAKEDQLNAEQRATVDKLAGEYADELDSLGVRVSNLEKKVGNISWSGDARMRFQEVKGVGSAADEDTYDGRIRLNMDAQVNDTVAVHGRFVSSMDFQDGKDAETKMDRLHVTWGPSDKFDLDLGRTSLFLGQTGVLYDDTFDGVKAAYGTEKFGLEAGYGRLQALKDTDPISTWKDYSDSEAWYAQAKGQAGPVALNAFYLDFVQSPIANTTDDVNLWGAGAAFNLGDKVVVDGDYIQNTAKMGTVDKPTLWTAGLTYGAVDTDKVGSFSLMARYVDAEAGSYFGSSTLDLTNQLESSWINGAKFWVARAGVAVAKSVELDAYYNFSAEDQDGNDLEDSFGVELNYAF